MNKHFGPWATLIDAGRHPQLSAFWRRRLTRLPAVAHCATALGWRAQATLVMAAGLMVALPTLRDTSARAEAARPAVAKPAAESPRVEMSVVVARHVLLLEGRQIVTWPELEQKIAALPDPSQAAPSFYITRGAYEAGLVEKTKAQIWRLHAKFKLKGHSEGSLWPRADLRYDRIETAQDLVPDQALRLAGRIVDRQGRPVGGAEVLLVAPVDPSIPYKTYDIALVAGRLRNPLEEIVTHSDDQGRFALYPPQGSEFYVVALHAAAGFGLARGGQVATSGEVRLLPWATLVSQFAAEAGRRQEASLRTEVRETDGLPEISFDQYWADLKEKSPAAEFRFTHVPPIFETAISRDFPGEHGAIGLSGATLSLLPGETRRLDLAPLSDAQRKHLQELKARFQDPPPRSAPRQGQGSSRTIDKAGIIRENGRPIGVWGIDDNPL